MPRNERRTEVALVSPDRVERSILWIRGDKVLLDEDLAEMYGVETKTLVRQVKRNLDRFPDDFLFQLTAKEWDSLRCQIGTSNAGRGGRRYAPFVFTEQGIAMLSSVLHSPRAVQVNIEIMRAFVRLRQMMSSHADLARKLEALEQKYDSQFKVIFDAIRQLMAPADTPPKNIGFHAIQDERGRRKASTKSSARKSIRGDSPQR